MRPRTLAALAGARAAGVHVLVATGRMFRSVRPYLVESGLDDPVICYQGAVVADPTTGTFLRHVPIDLVTAGAAIAAVEGEGFGLNCYVDDDLYVARITPEARRYADFQHLPITEVGDLRRWLDRPPTKLVVIAAPEQLDALKPRLQARFGNRLFIAKSLPHFLELASPDVSKGTGLAFAAALLGFDAHETVAFGDGENDLELLEWAGFGVAVAGGHERLLALAGMVCPPAGEEGVAQVMEAYLARSHGS